MQGSAPEPWAGRLLGVSLHIKIVVAATLLIGGAAAAGALVARTVPDPWLKLWLALGVLLVAGANALLVGLALRPLRAMESVVRRVEKGDLEARVPVSRLADRDMTRVVQVVNRMLDALERARDRERTLAARVSEAEELERKRLARELLDGTAQFLSSALVRIHLAQRGVPDPPPPGLEETCRALEEARSDALTALESIGRIARGLRPPELDELGASRAVEVQARHLTRDRNVKVEVEGDSVDPHLAPGGALAMYRILGEGIANALEHGAPTRIRLRYRLVPGRVEIDLEDDGSGFDPAGVLLQTDRHLGVLRMHERARYAGGRLEISSVPGEGTRLHLDLPRFGDPGVGA
ncbi:MAG: HAMP domain-containing protein [Gemmatimonadales bacterium]|nr:MAG: HAMP domain-containing protein [Gemmatimonadales bacterium]